MFFFYFISQFLKVNEDLFLGEQNQKHSDNNNFCQAYSKIPASSKKSSFSRDRLFYYYSVCFLMNENKQYRLNWNNVVRPHEHYFIGYAIKGDHDKVAAFICIFNMLQIISQ